MEKTDTCWLWKGNLSRTGYGQISLGGTGVNRRRTGVHRAAYELLVGPIPKGHDLDHLCRVRNCVNPSHLEPVTRKENLRRGEHVCNFNDRSVKTREISLA